MIGGAPVRVGFRAVFAVAEFRALWVAQLLSVVGDQLARVALSVLVFDRTGSALLTAAVYALGFLPAVVGGPLLGGLADRLPRRMLMIRCDLARVVLVVAMALSRDHLVVLCLLLVAVELLGAPFGAARAALLTDVLQGEHYLVASAVGNVTSQAAQVVGFAVGGGLVAVLGTGSTLLLDAVTFAASALLLALAVRARPAPSGVAGQRPALWSLAPAVRTTRLIAASPELRLLVLLALLCGFTVVPEGLAAPYATTFGGHAGTVGLLMAAQPAGAAVGALLLARAVPAARRPALMLPLAAVSCGALVVCTTRPGLVVTLALLALSGAGSAYQLTANAAFVSAVPTANRGQAFGLVQSAILAVQGLGFLLAGAAADRLAVPIVVAAAGAGGLVAVAALAPQARRVTTAG